MSTKHHPCCSISGNNRGLEKGCNGCACFSIAINAKIPYWSASWENEEGSIFLGTERNKNSRKVYDYWIVNRENAPSWTCKHGDLDHEYGSGRIDFLGSDDFSPRSLELVNQDYIFGIVRAKYFSLLYLAINKRPLLENEY